MYILKYFCIALLAFDSIPAEGQTISSDTTISFQVSGNCIQCKNRIEKAVKMDGVHTAQWDMATKILTVNYDFSIVHAGQLHEKVALAGHDTEFKNAPDKIYQALPECCLYREPPAETSLLLKFSGDVSEYIMGAVVEKRQGEIYPVAGANIQWMGDEAGTSTNGHGEFLLKKNNHQKRLIFSHLAFKTDTLSTHGLNDILITLEVDEKHMTNIVVSARPKTTYITGSNPFRSIHLTENELLKAACCNLSESFETNASVDVVANDAVTGSKQIRLLGLEGKYTQLTVENLPGPRGLATPLGLNSIAGPWVSSIQIIKGPGSVVNGFESIAGQINVELKKPVGSERLLLNGYSNSIAKTDFNLVWNQKVGKKWATGLLLHDDFSYSRPDENQDGFLDLPRGHQFSGVHRWQYTGDKGLVAHFGIKYLTDRRTGGQTDYRANEHKGTDEYYGLEINTQHWEAFSKIGYIFQEKPYQSIGLQLSAFHHDQDAYFGHRNYDALQNDVYANLIFMSRMGSEVHQFKTGISLQHDDYTETLDGILYQRQETVPGIFYEHHYAPSEKWDIVAGMRADYNNLYGWFATPRLHVRYAPAKKTTIRLSIGRGQRTANIFAENIGALVSARALILPADYQQNAYGLQPEVSWNKGISLDQQFKLFGRPASFGIDFFRNDFVNQVVVDMEDISSIRFYNLEGKSYANSLQAEWSFAPAEQLDVRMAYRYFAVKTTYGDQLKEKPLTAAHRAFTNIAYTWKGWKMDYTLQLIGAKRIPPTGENPLQYQMPAYSPAYVTMNAQISKRLGKQNKFELYLGGENLGNFTQRRVILSAEQPFGPHFDASMVWGPVSGRMIYGGVRYRVEEW